MSSYLLQEDGVSHFELENASGDILLEQAGTVLPGDEDFWTMPPTIPMSNDFRVTKF